MPADTPWARALAVFDEALDAPDAAERARVVDGACAGDPALRAAVERLLRADAADSSLLDTPASEHAAALVDDPPAAPAGRQVGPYRLVRELGRGGMGVVYLAERTDVPLRVALKLVRGGVAAPDHVARFLLERRVLARLAHPHIARLLDAGVADDGTPWFAMEYVDGEPIDRFCDGRRLGVAARVTLVEQVCEAVQYAHANLVVHRDLKPSNVLVTADGAVKLLDFGIAKLLAEGAADGAAPDDGATGVGTRLMTPDYAAPEQVRGERVTTATDVYALGVVLYELLAGRRPYATPGASPAAVERLVLAADPPRPSAAAVRAGASGDRAAATPEAVAAARGTTPERLRRALAGDLDTIVLKALDEAPARRYASAEQLRDDLHRHRVGLPVLARPDTLGYRTRTFVRRHRVLVAAGATAATVLAGFAGAMTYQQAQTARALRRAEAESAKAREVTRVLIGVFRDADPYQQPADTAGGVATAEALRLGTARIERELVGQPEVRGEVLHALGVIQRNLGSTGQSERLLRQSIAERLRVLGAPRRPDRELAALLTDLGVTLRQRSDYMGADSILSQALAMRRALLPADHPDVAATLLELGIVRRYRGEYADAGRLLRQAAAIGEQRADGPELATTLQQLAVVRAASGGLDDAERLLRQAVAMRERVLGRGHPAVASTLVELADVLDDIGRPDAAEGAAREALAIQRRRLAPGHPEILATESTLSLILWDQGKRAEAERLQRAVLAGRRRLTGDYHRDVAGSLHNLSRMLHGRGDLAGAERAARRTIAIYVRLNGEGGDLGPLLADLAVIRHERGDDDEATRLARRVVAASSGAVWLWDRESARRLRELAAVLGGRGDCVGARMLEARADAIAATLAPPGVAAHRPTPTRDPCGVRGR
ncbi:hypothetical protein tb265_29820 [Gemmatimonadetes bacterium T265]|nr:hypothetical protein tb265_29820 [Gemmatimonadetes bacterium T265]